LKESVEAESLPQAAVVDGEEAITCLLHPRRNKGVRLLPYQLLVNVYAEVIATTPHRDGRFFILLSKARMGKEEDGPKQESVS
jgi:hypothetical protein